MTRIAVESSPATTATLDNAILYVTAVRKSRGARAGRLLASHCA